MKLPTLLSGPILRRVERKQIYIWLAMSRPYNIHAEVFKILPRSLGDFSYEKKSVQTETTMLALGENLYGYLINIVPKDGFFPEDVLLGYNLHFTCSEEELSLNSFDLLSNGHPNSIVYGALRYPTFFIPKENREILFGSCRKLHGKGEDALKSGDEKLKETYDELNKRPSALFMLGDQIYADDVADPVSPFIQQLSHKLIGTEEDLTSLDERMGSEHFRKALKQVRGRQYIMEKFCHFTSGNAHNHLMTFGEFAAMYLLSYSPELWALKGNDSFKNFAQENEYFSLFPQMNGHENEFTHELVGNRRRYDEQMQDLYTFVESLPQIRRLLANIPTYMMFDDHEITDDYNLSHKWKENVESSPLGRHVIANGLAANWFFQSWGNAPEQYNDEFLKNIQNYMQSFDVQSEEYKYWLEQMLTFQEWSFVAPTSPKAIFLDTRTIRSYHSNTETLKGKVVREIFSGPQLIREDGWGILSQQLDDSGWESGYPLILISPSPFYGIRIIESFLHQVVMPLKLFNLPVQTKFDLEAWQFNGKAVHEFHRHISEWNPSSCIILSGDAHMASSVHSTVTLQDVHERKIQQFTSSPMKNDSFSPLTEFFFKGLLRMYARLGGKSELHRSCQPDFLLRYSKEDNKDNTCLLKEKIEYLSLPNGAIVETDNNLGLLSLRGDEAVVTLLHYEDGESLERGFK